jgi:quinone-modifying oxidoreductase subunit QmoB
VRAPYAAPQPNDTAQLVKKVLGESRIRVLTSSRIKCITGQPGQFDVEVSTSEGSSSFRVGAIVQATGAKSYDPKRLGHLGYGKSPNVVTSQDLEAMLVRGAVACPSNGKEPKRVVFIQCAGSRDADHLPYCSSECCATTLRQVSGIRSAHPGIETVVVYRDMRTPGQLERFYLAVQEQGGVLLTRGEIERVEANGKLQVHLKQSLLGDAAVLDADLVVLATGMVPNSADGEQIRALIDARKRAETSESQAQRQESKELAEKLAHHDGTEILNLVYRQGPDMPTLRYGFPDSHFICFPYETRRTGIYAAGALRAPMDPAQAAEDGWGAAMKAVQCVEAAKRHEAVHPRAGERTVPDFFLQRCTQCKRCTEECPFGTLNEDEKGTPQLQALRCRRCGICMGACPERIISFPDYSVDMVASMIKAIEVPEEYDEKPRILALLCENDALPALDAAAAQRRQWNPWVRVIPIRCLGSTNIVWIAEALGRGIDGMILIGCKYGDDYQCHYVRGSELANTRLGNVGETLQRLALEAERLKLVQLAHDEFERIPQILDEFAKELEDIGPNPLKGF